MPPHAGSGWELKETGVTARLRGLSPVSRDVVWASGSEGTVLRTVDGGRTWLDVSPPGTDGLQFRDVEAFDARRAVVLSIGEGADSRIYRTEDGGQYLESDLHQRRAEGLLRLRGVLRQAARAGDERPGGRQVQDSRHRGRRAELAGRCPPAECPRRCPARAGFAASGQCLVTSGGRDVWLASGGAERCGVPLTRPGTHLDGGRHADPGGRPGARRVRGGLPRRAARGRGGR